MNSFLRFVLLFCLPLGICHANQTNVTTPDQAIRRIIDSGLFEGQDQKLIGGIGDAAAVAVTKAVADSKLTSGQIDSILLILNSAFADVTVSCPNSSRTKSYDVQLT